MSTRTDLRKNVSSTGIPIELRLFCSIHVTTFFNSLFAFYPTYLVTIFSIDNKYEVPKRFK